MIKNLLCLSLIAMYIGLRKNEIKKLVSNTRLSQCFRKWSLCILKHMNGWSIRTRFDPLQWWLKHLFLTIINNHNNEVYKHRSMKHFFNSVKYSRNVKYFAYSYSPPPGILSFELHYKSSKLIVGHDSTRSLERVGLYPLWCLAHV